MKRFRLPSVPSKSRPAKAAAARGFTLIEVVAVLILLGILAAVAVSRTMDNTAQARAAADRLKVHLRYAQMQALNSDIPWGIDFTGSSYTLFFDGETTNTAIFPGENSNTIVTPFNLGTFTICFDTWGRPFNGAIPSGNSTGRTITISGANDIVITPETGFIP